MTMVRQLLAALLLSLTVLHSQCGGVEPIDETRFNFGYGVIPRRELEVVSVAPSSAPFLPSFDGNLDEILDLALAKAALSGPSFSSPPPVQAPSVLASPRAPSPSSNGPSHSSFNRQACDGIDSQSTIDYFSLVVEFMYALETTPSANNMLVGSNLEQALNVLLAPSLLACLNDDAASAGIVMLDSQPVDSISTLVKCEPEINAANSCTVWEGAMQVYLQDESHQEPARALILAALQITLDSNAPVDEVHQLVRSSFMAPEDGGPVASAENPPDESQLQSSLGMTTTLLISIGSAAVLIFAGAIYFYKRSKTDVSVVDATATNGWNSTVLDDTIGITHSPDGSVSPLSQMIPGAYGFSSSMSLMSVTPTSMSAIVEEQEHSISDNSSAIIMSEAGFSTADDSSFMSLDMSKSNYIKNPQPESPLCLLGARAYNPVIDTSNMGDESDSDLSSDLEGNYRSATPIPATGALDSVPGDGFLDLPAADGADQFNDSADDDLLLFTQ